MLHAKKGTVSLPSRDQNPSINSTVSIVPMSVGWPQQSMMRRNARSLKVIAAGNARSCDGDRFVGHCPHSVAWRTEELESMSEPERYQRGFCCRRIRSRAKAHSFSPIAASLTLRPRSFSAVAPTRRVASPSQPKRPERFGPGKANLCYPRIGEQAGIGGTLRHQGNPVSGPRPITENTDPAAGRCKGPFRHRRRPPRESRSVGSTGDVLASVQVADPAILVRRNDNLRRAAASLFRGP